MITLIVLGVLIVGAAVAAFICEGHAPEWRRHRVEAVGVTIMLGVVVSLFVCVITLIPIAIADGAPMVSQYRIYSLRHFDSTSDSFFLGCGTVGNERKYSLFRDTEHGIQQVFYHTYNTYIQEGATEPFAEYHCTVPKRWMRMVCPFMLGELARSEPSKSYYILHVPKGTITQEFSL